MRHIQENSKVIEMIQLADIALNTMDAETITRLRSSVAKFIFDIYGSQSIFYKNYQRIGKWSSITNFKGIKGLLLSIKDDIDHKIPSALHGDTANPEIDKLRFKLLELFYQNTFYTWEAIKNLVSGNADFFEFELPDAQSVFEQFKRKGMILFSGFGQAYIITDEGKKLFQRISPKLNSNMLKQINTQVKQNFTWNSFLCHSSKDMLAIKKIIKDFQELEISYWIDKEQIKPGDNIIEQITYGLESSSVIIACISSNQLNSGWCRTEYESILQKIISKKTTQKIIPLLLEDIFEEQIPLMLRVYRHERYFVSEEYQNLLSFLKSNS